MKRDCTTVLIPFVYFIAGAVGLAGIAGTFFYKEELGLSIQQVQILGSLSLIPWSIKPLYGLISDRFPIGGRRRKPYLLLAGIFGSLGYLILAQAMTYRDVLVATLVSALGLALADVIVDGIVAERSRSHTAAGKLQSICRAAIMLGALSVAYLSGILVESIGARKVFLITAFLPLCTSLLALFIVEPQNFAQASTSIRKLWQQLRSSLSRDVLFAAAFLFVWRSTPTSGGALTYYMIDELHFSPEFFGRLSTLSSVMGIIGVLVFRKFLLRLPLRRLLKGIIVASILLSLPTLGLVYRWYEPLHVSPHFFAMADTLISAPLTEIGFLPLLVLVARVCPKGLEATVFALLASLMNIGLAVSDLGGAALVSFFDVHQALPSPADPTMLLPANYHGLHIVLWIAILSSALPWPLLRFLPETRTAEDTAVFQGPSGLQPILPPLQEQQDIS
jgi:Na+/melibiose symporter-like transporter